MTGCYVRTERPPLATRAVDESREQEGDPARARLLREARAAGALDHPGIGAVYDAGEQDGEIFIAMRLIDGGTVADRLTAQHPLSVLDAVRIAANAADALGHAHARGILHRDVSSRNLKLTQEGQVVVVDFGLADAASPSGAHAAPTASASPLGPPGRPGGTPGYMAPEQLEGGSGDARSACSRWAS